MLMDWARAYEFLCSMHYNIDAADRLFCGAAVTFWAFDVAKGFLTDDSEG